MRRKGENMDAKKLFDKYYSRLAREGLFKALFCGLGIAFVGAAIVGFICYFNGVKGGVLWSALTLVLIGGAAVPLFYFKMF